MKFWTPISNWWWGDINNVRLHQNLDQNHVMNWKGGLTWFLALVGQRANGNAGILFNIFIFFQYFCIFAQFQKCHQDLDLLQHFHFPIQLFTEDWIVDWAVLAQIVEYSMHPILLKILFYANRPFKWVVLWCLFFFWQAAFFLQKSLCWERKWWGGVKDKDLTDFALIKLPPNSQFSLLSLEHGYEPFMRWSSYIVVLTMDLVFRRVGISITNHQR